MALMAGGRLCLASGSRYPSGDFRERAQPRSVEVVGDAILIRKLRHRFQDLRPVPVMAGVAANEQHVHRAILTRGERRELRVVGGEK